MAMLLPKLGEKKQEFISRFLSNKEMVSVYSKEDERYSVAIKQWKKRPKTLAFIKANMSKLVHKDTLRDKEYTVLPVCLMTEGIHNDLFYWLMIFYLHYN